MSSISSLSPYSPLNGSIPENERILEGGARMVLEKGTIRLFLQRDGVTEEWALKCDERLTIDEASRELKNVQKEILEFPSTWQEVKYRCKLDNEGRDTVSLHKILTSDDLSKFLGPMADRYSCQGRDRFHWLLSYLEKSPDPKKESKIKEAIDGLSGDQVSVIMNDFLSENQISDVQFESGFKLFFSVFWKKVDLYWSDTTKSLFFVSIYFGLMDPIKACLKAHPELVLHKTWKEAKGFGPPKFRNCPFDTALNHSNLEILRCLLDAGWDINHTVTHSSYSQMTMLKFPLQKALSNIEHCLNPERLNEKKNLFIFLLENGANPKSKFICPRTGLALSIAEYCFFYKGQHHDSVQSLVPALIQHGAEITPRMEEKMKSLVRQYPVYAELLIKYRKVSPEEIEYLRNPSAFAGSPKEYLLKMESAIKEIRKMEALNRGNLSLLNYGEIEKIKKLKKTVKDLIASGEKSLAEGYQELVKVYDAFVNQHYLLKELRDMSKELRNFVRARDKEKDSDINMVRPSARLVQIHSLWVDQLHRRNDALTHLYSMPQEERSAAWQDIRKQVLREATVIQNRPLSRKMHVLLLHGTKLTPPMMQTKALLPLSQLQEKGIAHFTGELIGDKFNKNYISCGRISRVWDDGKDYYFGASSLLMVSMIYATQSFGYGSNEKFYDPDASSKRVTTENLKEVIQRGKDHDIDVCCADILRLRATNKIESSKFEELYKQLIGMKLGDLSEDQKTGYKRIISSLLVPIEQIRSEELDLLEEQLPIVFGSTNRAGKLSKENKDLEYIFDGKMAFFYDLQVAFVSKDDLARATKLLSPMGIQVYTFESAKFHQTENMIRNAQDAEFEKSVKSLPDSLRLQRRIGYYLEQDILPKYSIPLPEKATYLQGTQRVAVQNPYYGEYANYDSYIEAVKEGFIPPRSTHGRMHACRVAILCQMFNHLYQEAGSKDKIDPLLLTLTGAAHDSQREDEGVDRWDPESAAYLHSYLLSKGVDEETAKPHFHAIDKKDPQNNQFETDIQRIVHDADCLEILRVLKGVNEFRMQNLQAASLPSFPKELISEWNEFIQLTESLELKVYLEQNSENYYKNVMLLLKAVGPKVCPTVCKYLREELLCFDLNQLKLPQNIVERFLKRRDDASSFELRRPSAVPMDESKSD